MTIYINPNGDYPRHIGDIKLDSPSWIEGQDLPEGWKAVVESSYPLISADEIAEETFPVLTDGVYVQTFNVRLLTSDEIARRDAPITAKAKLIALGLTDVEIQAILMGLIR
jgi:hypothetical protein